MTKFHFILLTILLYSCSDKRDCAFDSIENAVDCACNIITEKEAAEDDKEIIEKLKAQSNELNDSFEQAIKDSVFTEKEFITQLKSSCESF